MQVAIEKCQYSELFEDQLSLEPTFTSPPKHVTDLIVWQNESFWLHPTSLVLFGRTCKWNNSALRQKIIWCLSSRLSVSWFIPFRLESNASQ